MKELANRLAMQHLVNAYAQETGQATLLEKYQQNSTQISFSQGLTLLSISLDHLKGQVLVPLSYVSLVGRHRIAALPNIWIKGHLHSFSSVTLASLLLEELLQNTVRTLDSASLLERWIQSREALAHFLNERKHDFNQMRGVEQNFIETEQSLICGHSMHPAPKSRTGFIHDDWKKYSPETKAKVQLNFWLVSSEYVAEDSALMQSECIASDTPSNHSSKSSQQTTYLEISEQLKTELQQVLSEGELKLFAQYPNYKLVPLHPWQARYLQSQTWFKALKQQDHLIDLGELGWQLSPTTSVRTLASFDAPWQFKPSLSVMVTNSVRVNLEKEGHRGVMTYKLWHSPLGQQILQQCPSLKALNDPAWMSLKIDGQLINESLCIFREQPFHSTQQITCIASLCEDHLTQPINRFNALFQHIEKDQGIQQASKGQKSEIALSWFQRFLEISLDPMMCLYHRYGMAFESHQQNVLVELEHGMPKHLWLRDNQGFYYIEELAHDILVAFPELSDKAHAVGTQAFVDERFSYYFFGNTLFGIINAIGVTGYITEQRLIHALQEKLKSLLLEYPESTLLHGLLYKDTLPYKGNLLTRLYELDELTAPVSEQSVYIQLANPLQIQHQDVAYA
ncbi:IucA/IucC family protein [Acinetobacter lanii]|uniref:Siderophore biosynthesis protein n=1 Tax=Acinetobacter lanii TaxID=2715163 RepID=A0A6G8S4T9_9GAMM|nr:IucA/IucC family protein [Acinetobacter lanii]QIO09144.1 siderophore biosynthesis protein [Acinetobacter lanii]